MIKMENKEIKHFEILNKIDVSGRTETKKTNKTELTYLSWTWAWAETKKKFPNAIYGIVKNEKGLPYVYDELTGYMVNTWVEIEGIRYEMWLPVMDCKNKTMKSKTYSYKTKYGEQTVEAATMFDINKTLMRCLTKNLAMFGMGLYIYAGEDIPEDSEKTEKEDLNKNTENKASKIDKTEKEKCDKQEYLIKVKKILWEVSGKDKEKSIQLLQQHTAFKGKDGKQVAGVTDFEKLSLPRLQVTYGNLKKLYPQIAEKVKKEFEIMKNKAV